MNDPETAMWMNRLAELSRNELGAPLTESALPDPALIWWRAQLMERQAAQARVARPIAIAQWVSLAIAVAAMAVLAAVNWSGMAAMVEPAGATLWIAVGTIVLTAAALRFVFGE